MPGLALARRFFQEAVRPILDTNFPALVYSAGLIGSGSEVMGFDTPMSADHNWGPRVTLFLSTEDQARLAGTIRETLAHKLPFTFGGYSTHFTAAANEGGTVWLATAPGRPINHQVESVALADFLRQYTGYALQAPLSLWEWLTIPEQKLRTLAQGGVFHDGLGLLRPLQARLAYYPRDVWLYLLAAQWQRIAEEEAFVGRAGIVGDEIGSAIIAARLAHDLMQLCFLQERQYAPYAKWFGSGFARLAAAPHLSPILAAALQAPTWSKRESHLSVAYTFVAERHNALKLTPPLPTQVSPYYDRPFLVIHADQFADALRAAIQDEAIKTLPLMGKVDQFIDNALVLSYAERCQPLASWYKTMGESTPSKM